MLAVRRQGEDHQRRERRLSGREERRRSDEERLQTQEGLLAERAAELAADQQRLADRSVDHEADLERIAGLTAGQGKAELLDAPQVDVRRESGLLIRDIEIEGARAG